MRANGLSTSVENQRSPLAVIAWVLTGLLFAITIENLWLDPWLQERSKGRIALVPEALGGTWIIVSVAMAIFLLLLIFSHVLLLRDSRRPLWNKALGVTAALVAIFLCAAWFVTTSGAVQAERLALFGKHHSVTLRWDASVTPNVKYNVYRTTTPGKNWQRLNKDPIKGTKYKDTAVESGVTYYYVARSVNAAGKESSNSNLGTATIP